MSESRHLRVAGLLTEQAARAIHRNVADQLDAAQDDALLQRARRFADDITTPQRHHNLTPGQWAGMAGGKLGQVQLHVTDLSIDGSPRHARCARAEIDRAIGLLLVLDDALRDLEDDPDPARPTPA